jgi:hypothetical protein
MTEGLLQIIGRLLTDAILGLHIIYSFTIIKIRVHLERHLKNTPDVLCITEFLALSMIRRLAFVHPWTIEDCIKVLAN